MQLRAEREAALNRLRQQLEAAQRAERESVKQLVSRLEVQNPDQQIIFPVLEPRPAESPNLCDSRVFPALHRNSWRCS